MRVNVGPPIEAAPHRLSLSPLRRGGRLPVAPYPKPLAQWRLEGLRLALLTRGDFPSCVINIYALWHILADMRLSGRVCMCNNEGACAVVRVRVQ